MPFNPHPAVRKALAAYRSVRFSTKTGVRAYFTAKQAAQADVRAAIADARAEGAPSVEVISGRLMAEIERRAGEREAALSDFVLAVPVGVE